MSYDWRPRTKHIVINDSYRIYSPNSDYHDHVATVLREGGMRHGRGQVVAFIPELRVETYIFEDELDEL